jgi:xylulokinase
MPLIAGVDSSTQSCTVVIRDATTGTLVRRGTAPHPRGTEVDPADWWDALRSAIQDAGGLHDVSALSVAGQQHGMVCLDAAGEVIRPALLWNDTRSGPAAAQLVAELGDGNAAVGAKRWADAVGTVPVAALTVAKLRWLADHEAENAARVAAVALPHDWLTWKLSGASSLDLLVTDRSDASGTGYFNGVTNTYRSDLLALALRRPVGDITLPVVLGPHDKAGRGSATLGLDHVLLGPGCGDNAGAALGLGLGPGDTSVSLGTSGVVASVSDTPATDSSGVVAGFADATGRFLPLACTLNGARVLDVTADLLGVDHDELSALALAAGPGAGGLVQVPYFEGERTPNLPGARAQMHGMSLSNLTRENVARAGVEGLLGLLGAAMEGMRRQGVVINRVVLVGGGARSQSIREVAPQVWGLPVQVPESGDDVADGAARQAAWVLGGDDEPPDWKSRRTTVHTAAHNPALQHSYDEAARAVCAQLPPANLGQDVPSE